MVTNRLTDRLMDRQMDRQTDEQTEQTDRDRQTDTVPKYCNIYEFGIKMSNLLLCFVPIIK